MNREIKYRIWSKVINRWITDLSLENLGDIKNSLNDLFSKQECVIFQQFTGLEDKNDKQIFEGDILRCKGYDGWFDKIGHYYNLIVEYKITSSGDSQISGYHFIPEDREIIGNILENPELLKND